MTLKNDWFMNEELVQYANQVGLTIIKNPCFVLTEKDTPCSLCACYSFTPIENSWAYFYRQNYILIIFVENRKFHIMTRNRWDGRIYLTTESLDEVKAVVTDEIRKIKQLKIDIKINEIQQDFIPDELIDKEEFFLDNLYL